MDFRNDCRIQAFGNPQIKFYSYTTCCTEIKKNTEMYITDIRIFFSSLPHVQISQYVRSFKQREIIFKMASCKRLSSNRSEGVVHPSLLPTCAIFHPTQNTEDYHVINAVSLKCLPHADYCFQIWNSSAITDFFNINQSVCLFQINLLYTQPYVEKITYSKCCSN